MSDRARTTPAATRNLPPLIEALASRLPSSGTVLELASGPGQHAAALADRFPDLVWQPSDVDPEALASIEAWREAGGQSNIEPPLRVDLAGPDWWQALSLVPSAALAINVTHIAPWPVTQHLIAGLGRLLPPQGRFHLYGPFFQEAVDTAPSNLAFDRSLKASDPAWGLRGAETLDDLAGQSGFAAAERLAMPANNLLLTFRRLEV